MTRDCIDGENSFEVVQCTQVQCNEHTEVLCRGPVKTLVNAHRGHTYQNTMYIMIHACL